MTLDARDQEVWCQTDDVARALVDLLRTLRVDTVYVPALQCGHPDHDGVYVAAQACPRQARWTSTSTGAATRLYALDDRGTPGYGWLHPGLFPHVADRVFTPEEIARKSAALRTFATQVHDGSVVQKAGLDAPAPERLR